MADLRKLNQSDLEFDPIERKINNPEAAVNVINRIIDEIQRLSFQNDVVDKYVILTHGVDLDVSASELRNKLENVEILDYRPLRLTPVTDDLQDYEIINHSMTIGQNQTVKCRFFWNNPDTYAQLEVKLRLSS